MNIQKNLIYCNNNYSISNHTMNRFAKHTMNRFAKHTMNQFAKLMEKNPPARMSKPWAEEEVVQLLGSIKKKKTLADIATKHHRTVGGIRAQLKRINDAIKNILVQA